MLRVVIESPLNSPLREGIERNKVYAKQAVLDSLQRGEAPYASHLFFDQPGLLDDLHADQRKLGIEAGFAWGQAASRVAVYVDRGVSRGMAMGIERALAAKQPVVYRSILDDRSRDLDGDEVIQLINNIADTTVRAMIQRAYMTYVLREDTSLVFETRQQNEAPMADSGTVQPVREDSSQ